MAQHEGGEDIRVLALEAIAQSQSTKEKQAQVTDFPNPPLSTDKETRRFDLAVEYGVPPENVQSYYYDGPRLDPAYQFGVGATSAAFAAGRWNFPSDPESEAGKPTLH